MFAYLMKMCVDNCSRFGQTVCCYPLCSGFISSLLLFSSAECLRERHTHSGMHTETHTHTHPLVKPTWSNQSSNMHVFFFFSSECCTFWMILKNFRYEKMKSTVYPFIFILYITLCFYAYSLFKCLTTVNKSLIKTHFRKPKLMSLPNNTE